MLINKYVFIAAVVILILLAVGLLVTLGSMVFRRDLSFREHAMTIPDYLRERFSTFFAGSILRGLFRSLMFFAYLAIIPFVCSLFCLSRVAKVYDIVLEEGELARKPYVVLGERFSSDGEEIPIGKSEVCIINKTDLTFCLVNEFYAESWSYGSEDDPRETQTAIPPRTYLKTDHDPDYWFEMPETITVEVPKGSTDTGLSERWGVILLDSEEDLP